MTQNSNHSAPLFARRDVLRVGSLSVGASVIPGLDLVAAPFERAGSAKSVIYLWLGGGVTHIDSFDPKPEAPAEIRGELTAISTRLPGVQFCETMPRMASIADDLAVLRSYSHDSNSHLPSQAYTLSGHKVGRNELFDEPNLGSVVSHLLGPRNGLPGYIAVPGITRPANLNFFVGGWLGAEHAPFCVGGRDLPDYRKRKKSTNPSPNIQEDLTPKELQLLPDVTLNRLKRRAGLRQTLDQALLRGERNGTAAAAEGQFQSAMNLLTATEIRDAFDISLESTATRDEYGRTKIGGRCLMARRLVEAGARWVMVDYGYDPDFGNLWDNHCAPVQKQPHISKMCKRGYHLPGVDRAFAGLVTDLKQRGLLESTLVVFLTEFGRTPKINPRGGRDHWGAAGSLFFTGGGVQTGQIIGATDKTAAYPVTRPYTPGDVAATIFETLGIREARLRDPQNRPVPVLDHGRVIDGIL